MVATDRLLAATSGWSPAALMLGGSGILGLSIAGTLDTTGIASSPVWLHALLFLGGLWFVFVGLLGFYPHLADVAPRLSLGGALTSALGGAALTVGLVGSLAVALTSDVPFGEGPSWGPPLLLGAFVMALLSFLVYGVATVRSERPSRTVGLLLLVPVAGFLGQVVLLASKIATGDTLAALQLVLAGVIAVATIAVGHLLRGEYTADVSTGSRADAAP